MNTTIESLFPEQDWQNSSLSEIRRTRSDLFNNLYEASRSLPPESSARLQQQIGEAESLVNATITSLDAYQRDARTFRAYGVLAENEQTSSLRYSQLDTNAISRFKQYPQRENISNISSAQSGLSSYEPTQRQPYPNSNGLRSDFFHDIDTAYAPGIPYNGHSTTTRAFEDNRYDPHPPGSSLSNGNKRSRGSEVDNDSLAKRSKAAGSKQNPNSINDAGTYSTATGARDQSESTESLPRKRTKRRVRDNTVIPPPSGFIAPLRRPLAEPKVLSYNWDMVNLERKRRLSHFGYIEETEAGMLAPEPCTHCSHYAWGSGKDRAKLVCRIYNPETVGNYTKAIGNKWRRCSHCWMSGRDCSLVKDAERKQATA